MKTVKYERVEKIGSELCTMEFAEGPILILDFGKEHGGKLKLPVDFIADAVEHYLLYAIDAGLKEYNATKKRKK